MKTSQEDKGDDEEEMEEIPEFTMKAVQAAIDSLIKGKASDSDGRYQNMRRCDERDHGQIFNEVTRQKDCTREPWRKIKIKVIYKKRSRGGGWKLPPNLYITSIVHININTSVQQALLQA